MAVKGYQLITIEWCMVGLTFALVCFRTWARISRSPKLLPTLSDICVILAWTSFAIETSLDSYLFTLGYFDDPDLSYNATISTIKTTFAEGVLYLNCMYFVKVSMLCLFHEFFPRHMVKTRRALLATDVVVALGWISELTMNLFACWPLTDLWNPNIGCSAYRLIWAIQTAPHLLTDIMVYLLPVSVIYNMSLPRRHTYGLIITFSLGFVCIFFAAANAAVGIVKLNITTQWMFSLFEQTYAVSVGCSPALKACCVDGRKISISWVVGGSLRSRLDSNAGGIGKRDFDIAILSMEMRDDQQRAEARIDDSSHTDKISILS